MVDDTMEISSENGQNMEQSDIDIDLDLTATNVDEDYVLEDATSNTDFENNYQSQPSPAAYDDVMHDDDNQSFHMEDADLLGEGEEHITEQESMSFAIDGNTTHLDASGQGTEQRQLEQVDQAVVPSYDEEIAPNHDDLLSLEEGVTEATQEHETVHYHDEPQPPNSEDLAQISATQGSSTSIPSGHDTATTASAVPKSPSVSVPEPRLNSPEIAHDQPEQNRNQNSPSPDHSATDAATDNNDSTHGLDVRVVYRGTEYNLIATSTFDDSDSYFFADARIIDVPLSTFFKSIREVIYEDLFDEQELCLSVESLGLEAEEVGDFPNMTSSALTLLEQESSLADKATLGQIINVYADLLRNDGIEPSGEVFQMMLRSRPGFYGRFLNLAAGVAEGRGLTEILPWIDQHNTTTGPDDFEIVDESTLELMPKSRPPGELAEGDDTKQEPEDAESEKSNQPANVLEPEEYYFDDTQSKTENVNESDAAVANGDPTVANSGNGESPSPKKEVATSTDVDEDGDLIDYSDDEAEDSATPKSATDKISSNGMYTDFISRCLLPQFCFCPPCSKLMLLEYRESDEDSRRRSLSRTANGDKLSEKPTIQSPQFDNEVEPEAYLPGSEANNHPFGEKGEQTKSAEEHGFVDDHIHETENGAYADEIRNDQINGEDYENHVVDAEHDEFSAADVTAHNDEGHEDGLVLEGIESGEGNYGDDLGHNHTSEQGANDESAVANFDNVELDLDSGDTSFRENSNHLEGTPEYQEASEADDTEEKLHKHSLATVDTANSSVTMCADVDEIQYEDGLLEENYDPNTREEASSSKEGLTPAVAVVEYKDEIGYEDDDEEEVRIPQDLTAPKDTQLEAREIPNGNGKRPFVDAESSDIQTFDTKGQYCTLNQGKKGS